MKTILHTIDTTGPGGAETVFVDLATRLPADRFRSVVVIRGKGWVHDELCRRGVSPVLVDAKGSFNWRYLRSLAGLIRRHRVDLIQSHLLGANVYCSLAGLLTRVPVIATFHGGVDIGSGERFMGLKFAVINRGASGVVAVSESLRRELASRTRLDSQGIAVVYNGIDAGKFTRPHSASLRIQHGWPDDAVVVGCLGNIRPAKGYDILLRAAALLHKEHPELRFLVAGQGKNNALHRELVSQRDRAGLENHVKFIGFVDDPAEFLSNLDIYLLTSISEGFSISTIQAMAAGVPVIVTRSGGPEEIVTHDNNGWTIDTGSPSAVAEAVRLLAGNRELREKLAQHARTHVLQTFGMETMISRYTEIYRQHLGQDV